MRPEGGPPARDETPWFPGMRVGVLGNMNNNGFAIMRYFRDLGADAHLLLYANDGTGSLSHFRPENDTWDFSRWEPYVHRTRILNGGMAVVGPPASWLMWARAALLHMRDRSRFVPTPISTSYVVELLESYDVIVGSGVAPGVMKRVGRRLDIFFPYSPGIEFLAAPAFVKEMRSASPLKTWLLRKVRSRQREGVRETRFCLDPDLGVSGAAFEEIGVTSIPATIPMVYREADQDSASPPAWMREVEARLAGVDLTVISHGRQAWVNPGGYSAAEWMEESKHNDWLIRAVARLKNERPQAKLRLLLVDYGPDVAHSRALCAELGLDDEVIWLPTMKRREVLWLIARCDVGVGEFRTVEGLLWGGTGWEVLASGKPLLQSFPFAPGAFEEILGFPPPPMLRVTDEEDVHARLSEMLDASGERAALGNAAREWFDRYNGVGLAGTWLEMLAQQ
jgi:hypothetical protein